MFVSAEYVIILNTKQPSFPNKNPLYASMYSTGGFFHLASSDCLTKRSPLGMHELTCCIFMPHISWLRTMSREASQALSCPCRASRAQGGGGDPVGCREGGRLWTPRKSLGDQWPHWCSALKKAAHWHDVIFYMPSVIPPPPAIKPDEHTDTILTTWDHEEANVNVGSGLCAHFLFSLQQTFWSGLLDFLTL